MLGVSRGVGDLGHCLGYHVHGRCEDRWALSAEGGPLRRSATYPQKEAFDGIVLMEVLSLGNRMIVLRNAKCL